MPISCKKRTSLVIVILLLIGGLFTLTHPSVFIRNLVAITPGADTLSDSVLVTEYSYGASALEKIDVYSTATTTNAPIIVMVHGGAWFIGDKSNENVYKNKVDYWGPRGYIFVSVNYPMMDDGYKPDAQADAVAAALTSIQKNAPSWGGDPTKMVVMGHSAGAHLVALVSTTKTKYPDLLPWAGTVLLDSAAYNLASIMESDPQDFYIEAFGNDPAYWIATSPLEQLKTAVEPLYIVCSSNRAASVCEQADVFKNQALSLRGSAQLREEPLSHEAINTTVGLSSDYTRSIDAFIAEVTK